MIDEENAACFSIAGGVFGTKSNEIRLGTSNVFKIESGCDGYGAMEDTPLQR